VLCRQTNKTDGFHECSRSRRGIVLGVNRGAGAVHMHEREEHGHFDQRPDERMQTPRPS